MPYREGFSRGGGERVCGHQGIRDEEKLLLRGEKNPTEQDASPDISATQCLAQRWRKGGSHHLCATLRYPTQTPSQLPPASLLLLGLEKA